MKKGLASFLADCLVGMGLGLAVIIPGVSGGTVAVITNRFQKIADAIGGIFSKKFFKNLLILLPFGLFAILTIVALIKPFKLALSFALIPVMSLFAGFIAGSFPGIFDEVKGEKPRGLKIILIIIGFLLSVSIGVCSILFNFSSSISWLFAEKNFLLYLMLFLVGILSAVALIIPGLSGSAILLILGFYSYILGIGENLLKFDATFFDNFKLLLVFLLGAVFGLISFSKFMSKLLTKHTKSTYFMIIGLIAGSLISMFLNSDVVAYIHSGNIGLKDAILTPILIYIGFAIGYLLVIAKRNLKK